MDDPIDWSDPCARAQALSQAYYALLTGERESLIRFRSNDVEEEVRYQAADLRILKEEKNKAEADCEAANGNPRPKRFAVTAGYLKRC